MVPFETPRRFQALYADAATLPALAEVWSALLHDIEEQTRVFCGNGRRIRGDDDARYEREMAFTRR